MISGKINSGKSLFVNILNNKVAYEGDVLYEGSDLKDVNKRLYLNEVCFISEGVPFSFKTVENYIQSYIARYDAIKKKKKDIKALIRKFGVMDLLDKKMYSLSVSQKRLVSLVAGIAADSKVLIIDDLDSYLTLEELKTLKSILKKKAAYDGVTIIATCRYMYNFDKFASISITLDSGRIIRVRS
tara:strand:- start:112 stop:666 length:555 start_codon:yes stop_codon:yes gene_type:complete